MLSMYIVYIINRLEFEIEKKFNAVISIVFIKILETIVFLIKKYL